MKDWLKDIKDNINCYGLLLFVLIGTVIMVFGGISALSS